MADIRIGNTKWAFSNDTLLAYSTAHNKYKSIIMDSKRFSAKFRKDKDGVLSVVPNNTPTIDYEYSNAGALSIQKQVTTRNKFSEDFTGAEYFIKDANISTAGVNSPMNDLRLPSDLNEYSMRVTKLENTGSVDSYLQFSVNGNGQRATASIFFKKDVGQYVGFSFAKGGYPNQAHVKINLDTGLVVNTSNANSILKEGTRVIPYANGWYRLVVMFQETFYSQAQLVRIRSFNDAAADVLTSSKTSCFITGFNYHRTNDQNAEQSSYIRCLGATQTLTNDIITRINNVQYMLPKFAADSEKGLTWQMKFCMTRLTDADGYISLHTSNAVNQVSGLQIMWQTMALGNGNYGMRFNYLLDGAVGIVNAPNDFLTPAISEASMVVGRVYNIAVTFANGYLRLSVNGADANNLLGGQTPSNHAFFSPSITTSSDFTDLRLCKVNTQLGMPAMQILDMQIIDGNKTQTELNSLTLQ